MRPATILTAILALAVAAGTTSHAQDGDKSTKERIERLIQQLGHVEFEKRMAATKELESIGKPALHALHNAAKSDPSREIQKRAERIIQVIQSRPE
jgi:hypothetical protein